MIKKIKSIKMKVVLLITILAVIIFGSIIFLTISNIILNKKIDELDRKIGATYLKINSESNYYEIYDEDNNWQDLIKERTGLEIKLPKDWHLVSKYMKIYKNEDIADEFRIVLFMDGEYTFEDFTNEIFNQAIVIANDFSESKVMSWRDTPKKGYYEVKSFSETTYGNIYYDRVTENDKTSSLRHKVKMIKNNNKLIMEINKY